MHRNWMDCGIDSVDTFFGPEGSLSYFHTLKRDFRMLMLTSCCAKELYVLPKKMISCCGRDFPWWLPLKGDVKYVANGDISEYLDKWSTHSDVVIYMKVIFDKIIKAADDTCLLWF